MEGDPPAHKERGEEGGEEQTHKSHAKIRDLRFGMLFIGARRIYIVFGLETVGQIWEPCFFYQICMNRPTQLHQEGLEDIHNNSLEAVIFQMHNKTKKAVD